MCRVLGSQRTANHRQQMSWHVSAIRTAEISKRDYDSWGRGRDMRTVGTAGGNAHLAAMPRALTQT